MKPPCPALAAVELGLLPSRRHLAHCTSNPTTPTQGSSTRAIKNDTTLACSPDVPEAPSTGTIFCNASSMPNRAIEITLKTGLSRSPVFDNDTTVFHDLLRIRAFPLRSHGPCPMFSCGVVDLPKRSCASQQR